MPIEILRNNKSAKIARVLHEFHFIETTTTTTTTIWQIVLPSDEVQPRELANKLSRRKKLL